MDRVLPYTGQEFLKSLDDGREVWIYGERMKNIAEHPTFPANDAALHLLSRFMRGAAVSDFMLADNNGPSQGGELPFGSG